MIKGIIGTTGQIRVRTINTLGIVSVLNFLNLINLLCLYKKGVLRRRIPKYLGGRDHTSAA